MSFYDELLKVPFTVFDFFFFDKLDELADEGSLLFVDLHVTCLYIFFTIFLLRKS